MWNYILPAFHDGSVASCMINEYHMTTMGTVDRCHKEWASMIRRHGGKSNSSNDIASMVSKANASGFQAK